MGFVQSISELALWVEDVEAALAFYRDRLGFELDEYSPGQHAFLSSGDFLLVLFNPRNPGTALADEYLARTGGAQGGLYHAAFKVDPKLLDGLAKQLREDGVELKGPVCFTSGRRSYFLEDLDKHYLELTDL